MTDKFKSFHYFEDDSVGFSILETKQSSNSLLPAFYKLDYIDYPRQEIVLKTVSNQEHLPIHDFTNKEQVEKAVEKYTEQKTSALFAKLGIHSKFGILLYGPEGTGKSSICKYYSKWLIENKQAIVFYISNAKYLVEKYTFLQKIRKAQNNLIVIIFDEVEEYCTQEREGIFKNCLDGYLSINNSITFATTNYIDKIPEAVKSRPSRFKYSWNIEGIQNVESIKELIKTTFSTLIPEEEVNKLAKSLKGQSLDVIKQTCLDYILELRYVEQKKTQIGFKI